MIGSGDLMEFDSSRFNPVEAERALVAAILVDNDLWPHVCDITPEMFYSPRHGEIWQVCGELIEADERADIVTVPEVLRRNGTSKATSSDVAEITLHLVTTKPDDVAEYCRRVKEAAKDRAVHRAAFTAFQGLQEGTLTREEALQEIVSMDIDDHDWPDPQPLIAQVRPEFPTKALPHPLGELVERVSVSYQVPPALPAVLGLGVVATLLQRIATISIRPGWEETPNLYMVVAMESGTRKSPVFKLLQQPLAEYEHDESVRLMPEIARAHSELRSYEKQLAKAERIDGNDEERDKLANKVEQLRAELPVAPRFIAQDVTPEQLAVLLAENFETMSILSSEGELFEIIGGRYSDKGTSNIELLLKAFSADPCRVDRRSAPPVLLKAPKLTITTAIQPAVIRGMAEKPGFKDKGFLARFLYAMPYSNIGHRDTNPPPVPEDVLESYFNTVKGLFSMRDSGKATITLSDEARQVFESFIVEVERAQRDGGELDQLRDWGGKFSGAMIRVAANIHALHCLNESISIKTPITEATICVYYKNIAIGFM